ncbi:MAG: DNA replication and repair protein RecF, partial [Eubacteriales bacterium]
FCPDHLQLVKGAPQERRGFLNVALSQTSPRYLQQYADYVRLLNHRNCLLKQARKGLWYDPEELETWSRQLSVRAAELHCQRAAFVKQIEGFAQKILLDLSGGRETLTLSYDSEGRGETLEELTRSYQTLLTGNYRQEMAAGCSLYGVHRDDMGIAINGAPARVYASQGQQRSVVLALKMAEGEVSRECCGEYPVFLFDDVLSELDEGRRAYVFADGGDKQFILTSCEGLSGKAHQIQVEKGQYVSTHR